MAEPQRTLPHVGLGLILAIFCALGVYYSLSVPLFETPDEPAHYRYVRYIADERALPPLVVSQEEWEQGEFHQPPLYYALGALITGPLGSRTPLDDDPAMVRNPYERRGVPHAIGNKNVMLHTGDEGLKPGTTSLAVHTLRWLNVLLSCGTVALVYAIALRISPQRRGPALLATAVAAFNPQFVFVSGAANNDALITLLSTATLYVTLNASCGRARPSSTPIILGALIGAASLVKISGMALGALVPLAYLANWRHGDDRSLWRDVIRPTLIAGAVALAICGWWYIRNQALYGDLLGMHSYREIFHVLDEPVGAVKAGAILLDAFISYWGVFGWMNILAPEVYYLAVRLLCIAGAAGLILLAMDRFQRHDDGAKPWIEVGLLAAWLMIMLGLLWRWSGAITRTQGRLLFPAVAPVSILLVMGLSYWIKGSRVKPRTRAMACIALVVGLAGTAAAAPSAIIAPAYATPPILSLDELPDGTRGLDIAYGDEILLLGYQLAEDMGEQPTAVGEPLHVRLYWLCRARMDHDYTVFIQLYGRGDRRIAMLDTYPGLGSLPTSQWVPGQVISDDIWLPVDRDADAPVAAEVRLGIYHKDAENRLPARNLAGNDLSTAPAIARARVMPPVDTTYQPADLDNAAFGQQILLIGHSIPGSVDIAPNAAVSPTLPVSLYWRCLRPIERDYTVFIHLVDGSGEIVAQLDTQPIQGEYPTSYWLPDQEIKDEHVVELSAELGEGEYRLLTGLYSVETAERLPIAGQSNDNRALDLGVIRVAREETP